MKRKILAILLLFFATQSILSTRAYAMTENTRTLIRGGTYGLIGGTVVGLAVLPLTGSARGVFIGSSLGLYVGLMLGVYQITHRDDPENPFRRQSQNQNAEPSWDEPSTKQLVFQNPSPWTKALETRASFSVPMLHF